jgi:hypothetical protein
MSALLAVINTVVATPLPTVVPTPTPEVVTQIVYKTPEWVAPAQAALKQVAELGLLVVPAIFASMTHNLFNQKLTKWGNVLVLGAYSTVLGVLALLTTDKLNLANVSFTPDNVALAVLAVAGAASLKYAQYKASHPETAPAASTGVTAPF